MTTLIVLLDSAAINGRNRETTALVDQTDDAFVVVNQRRAMARYTRPIIKAPLPPQGGVLIQYVQPPRMARWVDSRLRPPQVVTPPAAPFVARPIRVTLVDQTDDAQILANQRRTLSRLRGPLYVVEPVIANIAPGGPGVRLAASFRGTPKSRLEPPQVVNAPAAPFVASPIRVELARIRPVPTQYRLGGPVVVYVIPLNFGPGVRLTPQSRGLPKSKLSPPTVTTPPSPPFVATPIRVELTRIRPVAVRPRLPEVIYEARVYDGIAGNLTPPLDRVPRTISDLRRPIVVTSAQTFTGPKVELVRIRPPLVRSRLEPPVVIDLRPQTYFIETKLVRIRPVRTISRLEPPTDLIDRQDLGRVAVHLAPSFRGIPKSVLREPVVIDLRPQTYFLAVTLAPSFRGKPKSKLYPPVVVTSGVVVVYFGPKVELAKIRPVRTIARLLPVPAAFRPVGSVSITLAPQKRGVPKSILRRPIVIDLRPQVYYLALALAPSFRGKPKSILRRPTDLVDRQDLGSVRVHLAYSSRGEPKSRLIPPTVVGPVLARPILVQLAPSRFPAPKSRLEPPTVVFPFFARRTDITLVRIRPVPTLHVLRRPVDLVDREDLGFVRVHLAYQSRGKPESILRKPVVIDLRPQTYYVSITLAPQKRGKPKSFLRPDSKFAPQPQADYTILIHLAPPSRGKPKSKLRPPAVVGAGIYFRGIRIKLAPSRFPKPKSRLQRVPPAFRPVGFTAITLAPSRFPRPKSVLRKPVVTQRFRIPVVKVTLVRIRPVPVRSELRPPTDLVDRQDLGFVRVHLAPSRFPKPISRLEPPTVVGRFVAEPTRVTLAPQRRGTPRSFLKPPTVIGAAVAFYGPRVTLVRIRPPRTHSRLPLTLSEVQECFGTVVGFDFGPEVCGDDTGATVTGSTSAGQTVSGSDSGATVTGASAPGGSVTGGDEKREGC